MTDDLVKRLRAQHNDTWPLKIGHGDLINEDGPEAASRIAKLETALLEIAEDCELETGLVQGAQVCAMIARQALDGKDD
jgi:hypothetical protein